VTGRDGKEYPAKPNRTASPKEVAEKAKEAVESCKKKAARNFI
jgi:hypothetical protein